MRVLAINDISCVGRCSLTVTLPVVSACGVECNVLPTAILSTHTGGFTDYTFQDLTEHIPDILRHWESLHLKFDIVYSGYLGSVAQIQTVRHIKERFLAENGVFIVDPVMGDDGKLYAGFTETFVVEMRKLCKEADYILPNSTEACLLTELPYPLTQADAPTASERLRTLCPHPIVTGVTDENTVSIFYGDDQGVHAYTHENVEGFFCGAGDVFASAFTGCLARGLSEKSAIELASDFTAAAIRRSAKEVTEKRYGLNFEAEIFSFLKNLNEKA